MCGRFTYALTRQDLERLYRLTLDQPLPNTRARCNVCPTDPIDTVVERDGKREVANTLPCLAFPVREQWGDIEFHRLPLLVLFLR